MSAATTPQAPGHFWAKLITPSCMPAHEDWASVDWEVVQVFDNNGEGANRLRVMVPGSERSQPLRAFIWGPRVPDFTGGGA